jgi:phage shock protein A
MNQKVNRADAVSQARTELLGDNVDDQFAALEKHDEVERLLAGLKSKKEVA